MAKVVITFGRMNPPTIGHQKLVDKVEAVAKKEKAPAKVYLSHTQNNKKDPLNYAEKIRFARKAFGKSVTQSKSKTIFQIMDELDKQYDEVVMVVGSDRVTEFNGLLQKYNGRDYDFKTIKVVSAGARDPDATGVEGMSASKLRATAVEGDFDTFKSGLPKKLNDRDAKDIYDTIRSVIKEDLDEDKKPLSISQRKAIGRRMKRLAPKLQRIKKMKAKKMADAKTIQKRAQKQAIAIVRKKVAGDRGKSYATLSPSDKIQIDKLVAKKAGLVPKIAKKILPKVRKAEIERLKRVRGGVKEEIDFDQLFEARVAQDKDIKDREGTQPKKYHSGLSKSTKAKRDAQFKKGAEKDSDDPSAYPDKHAGDAGAKTRTSKHTKKYHDMFGEGEVDSAKEKIDREKASDKKKHDRMLDRARTADTKAKNQEESFEITEDSATALKKKSEKSGISLGILKKVYNRGMAAWKTGHRPGASQQQWAYARVNSFITGGKTRTTGDADLWAKHKGKPKPKKESVNESMGVFPQDGDKFALKKKHVDMIQDIIKKRGAKRAVSDIQSKMGYSRRAAQDLVDLATGRAIYGKKLGQVGSGIVESLEEALRNPYKGKPERDLKRKLDSFESQLQDLIKKSRGRQRKDLEPEIRDMETKVRQVKVALKEDKELLKEVPTTELIDRLKARTVSKNKYKAALEVLKQIYSRKKKEAKGSSLKHSVDYYAAQVAKQYNGVTARVLAKMYKDAITEEGGAGEEGTNKLVAQYKKDTPCQECTDMYDDLIVEESEYQGRKVKLNDPFRLPAGSKKKFGVYVKNDKGNVVKVTFGDPNMEIKRDDPERRKSFRARHDCDNKTDKTKAGYWSCYQWRASKKVDN